ncbi:MAG: xanthine dehydrogenase family protein molybdopterin-binding subunit [Nitrososphaerales archaeon]|jgi:CO/xanthine dehydrogenase Mo-binding subunit
MQVVEPILEEELMHIGKSIPRIDSREKVTGAAVYSVDMKLPHMLYVKLCRSTLPHAEIVNIDVNKASQILGVRAILTAKDFPDVLFGAGLNDTPIIARDKVRYVGEVVAAVAAESEDIATEAVEAINVEYKELPAIYDPEQSASEHPAAILHPNMFEYKVAQRMPPHLDKKYPNVCNHVKVRKGDAESAFKQADLIIENRFSTHLVHAVHMEPIAAIARAENDGTITVWSPTQSVYRTRYMLSDCLRMPQDRFRVIATEIGGGFGNKLNAVQCEAIATVISIRTKRPAKVNLTREEVFATTTTRHPFTIYIKDGVMKDGRIIARRMSAYLDGGAYSGGSGVSVARNAVFGSVNVYDIPNIMIDNFRVYTSRVPAGAFRGYGTMQVCWAIESQMNIIAEKLVMNPVKFRQLNLTQIGRPSAIGEIMQDQTIDSCLNELLHMIDFGAKSEAPFPWKVGKGVAVSEKHSAEPGSCATVIYRYDGHIDVWVSVDEIGQGTQTGIAQIVAEEFRVPMEKIRVGKADTYLTPYDSGALSSRQLINIGNAAILACRDLKKNICETFSKRFGAPPDTLTVASGRVRTRDGKEVDISDLYLKGKSRYGIFLDKGGEFIGTGTWYLETGELDGETGMATLPRINTCYTSAATGAEVAVNTETGQIKIQRLVAVVDVGRAINPKLVEGQIEGGLSMGVSTSLYEEMLTQDGKVLNPDFKDYKMLNSGNAFPMVVKLLEIPSKDGPFGAKGAGEVGIVGVAPAIANAIYDAVGVRISDLPITAEKILTGLTASRKKN